MVNIDLDELQKAKDLIGLANSVPLEEVAWQRGGVTVPMPEIEFKAWKYVGLTNVYFAYEHMMTPNAELTGAPCNEHGEANAD